MTAKAAMILDALRRALEAQGETMNDLALKIFANLLGDLENVELLAIGLVMKQPDGSLTTMVASPDAAWRKRLVGAINGLIPGSIRAKTVKEVMR